MLQPGPRVLPLWIGTMWRPTLAFAPDQRRCPNCRRLTKYYGSTIHFCQLGLCWPCSHVFVSAALHSLRRFTPCIIQSIIFMLLPQRLMNHRRDTQHAIWLKVLLGKDDVTNASGQLLDGSLLDATDKLGSSLRLSGSFRSDFVLNKLHVLFWNCLQPSCRSLVRSKFEYRDTILHAIVAFLPDFHDYRACIVSRICRKVVFGFSEQLRL